MADVAESKTLTVVDAAKSDQAGRGATQRLLAPSKAAAQGWALPKKPAIMMFIGKPGSGKSHCIKSLLYSFQKNKFFGFGMAFVATKFNHDYEYLPDELVSDQYTDKNLEKYINLIKKTILEKGKDAVPNNFIILDDLLGRIKFYSDEFTHFISTFRHTKTYVFISSQYLGAKGSSTALREYCNHAFLWRSNTANSVDMLYNAFGLFSNSSLKRIFANQDEFHDLLMTATDPTAEGGKNRHRCLLASNVIDEEPCFHFFKAATPPPFKIKM
jgi:hypothetical protein